MNEERRCLIIDCQPTLRLGVRELLADRYEVEEAETGSDALELMTTLADFDVAIVALACSPEPTGRELSGIRTIRALRKARPGLGIVAHGPRPEPHLATEAIAAGATGFVAKSSAVEALAEAVDAAADAEEFVDPAAVTGNAGGLTRRQREILQLYADGCSTSDVADRLGRSTETVRTHAKAVLGRLEARDRAHAVAIGLRNSLIE